MILTNPAAARARRGAAALRDALPEADAVHHVTERPEQVASLIGHDHWRPQDLLVINGGDGSVQHALTVLLGRCPPERLPRVACLPGGTTNMTAFDLNRHRRFHHALETLRCAVRPGEQLPAVPRRVVRVRARGAANGSARVGLFFGIGTIVQGIEYFHARIRHNGGAHELGAGIALMRTLWGIARRDAPFAHPLAVQIEATAPCAGNGGAGFGFGGGIAGAAFGMPAPTSTRLLFATTLDRLFLGMRPYWGSGAGMLKSTMVEARAPAFVPRIPRLLRGRPDRAMTPRLGYHSARLDSLTLTFGGSYTLDGELFGNAGDTIEVSATRPVTFLSL